MAMRVTDLQQKHPHYDPYVGYSSEGPGAKLKALETYSDFYRGGHKFNDNKKRYLRTRPIEAYARSYRDNRLSAAYYTPHAGGIGANLCGTALQYPPTIEVKYENEDKAKKTDDRLDYWRGLNDNLDGRDSDTRSVAWCLLENLIVHRRAYLAVNFPKADKPKDATFAALTAKEVDDWQIDENGNYEWVRTHCIDLIRSQPPYGPVDTERHTWTFYTDENVTEFVADRLIGTEFPKNLTVEGKATPHGLKVVPIFPIEVEEHFWVMDRLFSTAHAYFNREASRAFCIDTGALSLPVVKTQKSINNLVTASGFCIHLGAEPNEDFFYRSPDAGIYGAMKEDCEYLLGNLYSALNQMALTAAGQKGNPRQSGTAKTADAASIKAFLSLLCSPIMSAFRKAFKAVQDFREESDLIVQVHGMSQFDVQVIELEINRCLTFNSIAGMPQTARKESMRQAIRAYLPDLDETVKETIDQELKDADLPEVDSRMAQVVTNDPGEEGGGITNATTGRPQGFAPGQVSQASVKGKAPPPKPPIAPKKAVA